MSTLELETIGLVLGLLGGGSALLYPLIKKTSALFKAWGRFAIDWEGSEATPGRDAVPGVMARLNKLDGELSHNGGNSIKDMVFRMEVRQDRLERKIQEAEVARQQNQVILLEAIKMLSPQTQEK